MDALYAAIAVNQNSLDHAPPEKFIFPFIGAYLAVMALQRVACSSLAW